MKTYELVTDLINQCGGASNPVTTFSDIEAESPEAYIRAKHPVDCADFKKTTFDNGDVQFVLDKYTLTYRYTFSA
ncbi:hypothetical protein [Eubacterium aggregans]|uniref:hypothetical protein n=1 Tax=Eubacterium aggregans TaxID=81409 RepID=UPI003F381598